MKRAEDLFRATVQPVLLLLCVAVFCGCSILGFATGALIDGSEPDNVVVRTSDAEKLGSGDHIRVTLVDSSVVEGTFRGITPLESSIYASRYARFLQKTNAPETFPRLGDTLRFTTKEGTSQQWEYVFRGFGLGTVELQRMHQFQVTDILYKHLSMVENRAGVKFDLAMLERMSDTGQLPCAHSVHVQTKIDIVRVPLDDIKFIEKANSTSAKWIGLGAGLVIDAIIVASYKGPMFNMSGMGSGY